MLTRSLTTTLLQIFFELLLYSQVISESMKVADNTFLGNSECEWVKLVAAKTAWLFWWCLFLQKLYLEYS